MNEEEFFRKYMNPDDGIYRSARLMGRMAGERDIVGNYFKRIRNAQGLKEEIFFTRKYKRI